MKSVADERERTSDMQTIYYLSLSHDISVFTSLEITSRYFPNSREHDSGVKSGILVARCLPVVRIKIAQQGGLSQIPDKRTLKIVRIGVSRIRYLGVPGEERFRCFSVEPANLTTS